MNHFIVSFGDTELTDEQSARVQSAIEKAAKKEFEALPITQLPTGPGPGHNPTGGRGPSGSGGTGTGGSTQGGHSGPTDGTGTPIGKHPLPITFPVSYHPSTKSWKRA